MHPPHPTTWPSILNEADIALIKERWHLDDWVAHPALFHLREHTIAYIGGLRSSDTGVRPTDHDQGGRLAHV